jgi:hypothetical protein
LASDESISILGRVASSILSGYSDRLEQPFQIAKVESRLDIPGGHSSIGRTRGRKTGTTEYSYFARKRGVLSRRSVARLLQSTGKFMRHVKLRPGTGTDGASLSRLIETAYSDIKARVENG